MRWRWRRGQALVEFALIAPVLFLILFAIFDVGRLVYVYNNLSNSTRNGARAGIVTLQPDPPCTPGTTTHVQCAELVTESYFTAVPDGTAVASCDDANACAVGSVLTVTASSQVTFLTPVISQLLGPITVSATTQMGVES
ncbi:MAG TPA: TadE family protein [Candidatus Limnocylindrales bacterium]|nr:TadE family protein [Candidatus Limnocylindrales bacterium]